MSLRIVTLRGQTGSTFQVSGRLMGPWIVELEREFDFVAGGERQITVDISDVTFVAIDAVELLRGFLKRGAALRGCPPYLLQDLQGSP